MNPFDYSEFWLSLAFVIVIGMIVLSPVRVFVKNMFNRQRQIIIDQIQQADDVLKEAQALFNEAQQNEQVKQNTKEMNQKIKEIQLEYAQKTQAQIEAKKQDFQVRSNSMVLQIKKHLCTTLLDKAQEKILKNSSSKSLDKDVQHVIQMLHNNKDKLAPISE